MSTQLLMLPTERPYHWTVEKYHQLIETGILDENDKVELVNGEIVQMAPIDPPHASAVDILASLFFKQVPGEVIVRVQNPVTLDGNSEPEPDIALIKMAEHRYRKRHPNVGDIFLLVEVSDSSEKTDRSNKIPVYAKAGVPEVWLVNLVKQQLWVHLDPHDDYYKSIRILQNETVSPVKVPTVSIDVGAIF